MVPGSAGASEGKKRGGPGVTAPVALSPALAGLLGVPPESKFPRGQIVKRVWEYIKAHDLQDPSDGRKIRVEGGLERVFTAPLDMFSMNRQLSQHVGKTDGTLPPATGRE